MVFSAVLLLLGEPLAALQGGTSGGSLGVKPSGRAPQGEPPSLPLEEIVRRFAEKEQEYARAHSLFRYRLSVKIQEIGDDDRIVGEFEQVSEVDFDRSGRRLARLVENPHADLLHLGVRQVELDDLLFVPLFILSPEDIPEYEITYVTRERVDEVDTYLFRLKPNHPPRPGQRLFDGIVWVDADKLDIVRAHGRSLPARTGGAFKEYFQRVEVFRQPVDDYLFPTYVRAEDVIAVYQKPTRARLVIRLTNHERVREPAAR